MTVLVGIACTDGVVIGSDSRATLKVHPAGLATIEQSGAQKTFVIEPDVLFAGSGQAGLAQRFHRVAQQQRKGDEWSADAHSIGKLVAHHAIDDFKYTGVQANAFRGAFMAFVANDGKPYLCEFTAGDVQPQLITGPWFASLGDPGQLIADPFLGMMRRVFFKESGSPKLAVGKFLVYWALYHAADVNPGGINEPSHIGVLEKSDAGWSARLLSDEELREHHGNVLDAERHLMDYLDILAGSGPDTDKSPDPPPS